LQESVRLYPDGVFPYWNLMVGFMGLGHFEQAKAVFGQARAHQLDGAELRDAYYKVGFVTGDEATMREQVSWATGKPEAEGVMLANESGTEAYHGRLVRAREYSRQAVALAISEKASERAATWKAIQTWREAEIGNSDSARRAASAAMKQKQVTAVRLATALTVARIGDAEQAGQLADQLNREFPLDTLIQNYWLPSIRAAIAIARNKPQEAIQSLEPARAYELSTFFGEFPPMQPAYLRGLAYLEAGQGKEAAFEFQNIINHRGINLNMITGALAYLQLGRAQAMMGDKAGARKSYQDFLALWKVADPDIPIYQQAKAEYAKLQ
jgi:predicted Zn-dependent protease